MLQHNESMVHMGVMLKHNLRDFESRLTREWLRKGNCLAGDLGFLTVGGENNFSSIRAGDKELENKELRRLFFRQWSA